VNLGKALRTIKIEPIEDPIARLTTPLPPQVLRPTTEQPMTLQRL
jgi:hypothetical protein